MEILFPQYCYYYYYIRIIFIKIEQNYVQAVLKKVIYSILLSVIRFSGGFSSHLREKAKHLIWRRRYSLPSTPSNRPITYSCKVRSEDYYLLLSTFIHYYPLLLSTTIIIHYYYYPLLLLSTIGTASIQSLKPPSLGLGKCELLSLDMFLVIAILVSSRSTLLSFSDQTDVYQWTGKLKLSDMSAICHARQVRAIVSWLLVCLVTVTQSN